jgi:undecaprenyl diphosphate synthase
LLSLLKRFIRQDVAELHGKGVRIRIIGAREELEPSLVRMLEDAENLTAANNNLTLVVAFNYGSQQEILRAVQKLALQVEAGTLAASDISLSHVEESLDTATIPPVDLLIRTGGEERISNFLLWQSAYAEFVFLPNYWPDFDAAMFEKSVATYQSRERRFGGLKVKSA